MATLMTYPRFASSSYRRHANRMTMTMRAALADDERIIRSFNAYERHRYRIETYRDLLVARARDRSTKHA